MEGLWDLEIDKCGFTSYFIRCVMLTRPPSFYESVSLAVKKKKKSGCDIHLREGSERIKMDL